MERGGIPDAARWREQTCEVQDGGDVPEYVVWPEDDPEHPITGDTTSKVWLTVLKRVEDIKVGPKRKTVSVSGPEYFGFANKNVMLLIQVPPVPSARV